MVRKTIISISNHAPTWGATYKTPETCPHCMEISIHAPTWGATMDTASTSTSTAISIHAPTWGATFGAHAPLPEGCKFQSTHPHGVRQRHIAARAGIAEFQSTHPHGVRLQKQCNIINCKANMSIIIPHPRIYYIFQAGKPPFNHHISQPLVRIPFAENVSLGFAS